MAAQNNSNPTPTRVLYPINEACHLLGVSRSSVYNEIKAGRLKLTKVAGRSLISDKEIRRRADEASEVS